MEEENIKLITGQLESMEDAFDTLRDCTYWITECLKNELNSQGTSMCKHEGVGKVNFKLQSKISDSPDINSTLCKCGHKKVWHYLSELNRGYIDKHYSNCGVIDCNCACWCEEDTESEPHLFVEDDIRARESVENINDRQDEPISNCICGHSKAFHELDNRGWCVHGLILTDEGVEHGGCCACKIFTIQSKGEEDGKV